ncbi:M3 family oligoendopeptidase [Sphaerochaeta globosa]|uniref:Oligoendopeptidase, pepF/M3 family n=1 Tax=Sphaerochaeta globosa (strain ATCC BAA-1886 / DSM 22777 / Buddy) TaxID=158189 RepID=F0RUY4_SPHGB|nr:M3 family oligoendopeptidase [Sphaerochaeta globosa]ADY12635.1 oligoendopeptidase, pepF/M3 family [Sphaerochaeta globosa str. Buddy]
MTTLPAWDLTPIYPSCDSKEFSCDLETVATESKALEVNLQVVGSDLKQCIQHYELVLDYMENLHAYSSACLTTDTSNPLYLKAMSQVEEVSLVVQHLEVLFLNYLAKKREEVELRTREGGDLEAYRFPLHELLEDQKHQMPPELEDLASDLARSGTDAFSRQQEAMGSSIHTQWDEKTIKTVVQLRSEATNADRSIRKRAFEKELALWKAYEVPFAAALNGVKGTTLTLDKMRLFTSPLDRSLFQSRIDRPILDALIATLEASLPLFRKYLKKKAELLGLTGCAFYDLFAPVGKKGSHFTYEEAQEFIVKQFSVFSKEMGDFADHAFKARWIDAESRNGKVGGAYDTSFPLAKQSRILSNFDYTYSGVSTLAHELGHAWHDSIVLPKSNLLRTYPMTLAETASIFSEFLVFQGALANSTADQRLALVEQFVQDATQVCVDILSRYYFESEVFTRRNEGDLSAGELCSIMEEAQKKTYGDGLVEYHPYMWAAKGHYYSSDFSFYNYPYAFGQLFALGLYEKSRHAGSSFPEQYKTLLSATGSLSAREVASLMDIDLADRKFWQQGMDVIASYIGELCDAPVH